MYFSYSYVKLLNYYSDIKFCKAAKFHFRKIKICVRTLFHSYDIPHNVLIETND